MVFRLAFQTHTGRVREHNEDNFTVNPDLNANKWIGDHATTYKEHTTGALLVVADGMGGVNAGEVASALAIESIQKYFSNPERPKDANDAERFVKKAFHVAQESISAHEAEHPETNGMGTTLVLAWILNDVAHIGWVGDSRAYVFNPGNGLKPLSKDHSLVQEWVDAGKMTYEQAFFHPQNNVVTQSLGGGSTKITPGYVAYPLQSGDQIMLCSDGLNGMLLDSQIEAIMRQEIDDLRISVETLVDAALDAGGHDNVTVVAAAFPEANGVFPTAKTSAFPTWLVYAAGIITAVVLGLVAFSYLNADRNESSASDLDQEILAEEPIDSSGQLKQTAEQVPESEASPVKPAERKPERNEANTAETPPPAPTSPTDELTPITPGFSQEDISRAVSVRNKSKHPNTQKWGFKDYLDEWVVQPEFQEVKDFSQGRAAVKKGELWGYVDLQGQIVIEPQYQDAQPFKEGMAIVKLNEKVLIIDLQGNPIEE